MLEVRGDTHTSTIVYIYIYIYVGCCVYCSPIYYLEMCMHGFCCILTQVRWVIRNIVRDWGAEGQRERDECYKPILEELDSLFPDRHKESTRPACLVPGAGLGRLALEISCLGMQWRSKLFFFVFFL
jgi:hypothetical protein